MTDNQEGGAARSGGGAACDQNHDPNIILQYCCSNTPLYCMFTLYVTEQVHFILTHSLQQTWIHPPLKIVPTDTVRTSGPKHKTRKGTDGLKQQTKLQNTNRKQDGRDTRLNQTGRQELHNKTGNDWSTGLQRPRLTVDPPAH